MFILPLSIDQGLDRKVVFHSTYSSVTMRGLPPLAGKNLAGAPTPDRKHTAESIW